MLKSRVKMVIFALIFTTVVVAFIGYAHRINQAQEQYSKLHQSAQLEIAKLKSLYDERLTAVLKANGEDASLVSIQKDLGQNPLSTTEDFNRFDAQQNQVSDKIGALFAARKKRDEFYAVIFKIEEQINRVRVEYFKLAEEANQLSDHHALKHALIPQFKSERYLKTHPAATP